MNPEEIVRDEENVIIQQDYCVDASKVFTEQHVINSSYFSNNVMFKIRGLKINGETINKRQESTI